MSPLSTLLNTPAGSFNTNVSDDYSKLLRSSNGNVASSANDESTANMALTKYNDNYRLDSA